MFVFCAFQLYRASTLFETIRHETQHSTDYKLSLFDLQTSSYQALQRVLVSLGELTVLSSPHVLLFTVQIAAPRFVCEAFSPFPLSASHYLCVPVLNAQIITSQGDSVLPNLTHLLPNSLLIPNVSPVFPCSQAAMMRRWP